MDKIPYVNGIHPGKYKPLIKYITPHANPAMANGTAITAKLDFFNFSSSESVDNVPTSMNQSMIELKDMGLGDF